MRGPLRWEPCLCLKPLPSRLTAPITRCFPKPESREINRLLLISFRLARASGGELRQPARPAALHAPPGQRVPDLVARSLSAMVLSSLLDRKPGPLRPLVARRRYPRRISGWSTLRRADEPIGFCSRPFLSVVAQEREDLRGPLGRLLERRPVPAVVEKHEARVGNVVEDRDADLEGHHPVVSPVDQRTGAWMPASLVCSRAAGSPIAGALR